MLTIWISLHKNVLISISIFSIHQGSTLGSLKDILNTRILCELVSDFMRKEDLALNLKIPS